MQKFDHLTGPAVPMPMANIDTDQIIPKQFLKTVEREGLGKGLFYDFRFDFDGDSLLHLYGEQEARTITATGAAFGRGTGIVELLRSIRAGVPERASGALASHVLDILLGIRDAALTGHAVEITSKVAPIAPLPESFDPSVAQ